jgi:hypothetical protein
MHQDCISAVMFWRKDIDRQWLALDEQVLTH